MKELKRKFQEVNAELKAYADQKQENGYSLIVWDEEKMMETTRGKSRDVMRQSAWILGRKIGEAIKEDCLSIETLHKLIRRSNEIIIAGALEAIEERAGTDWLNREAFAYMMKARAGEVEKQLAEQIWKEAETDD